MNLGRNTGVATSQLDLNSLTLSAHFSLTFPDLRHRSDGLSLTLDKNIEIP